MGKLADRPAIDIDNAVYIATDAAGTSGRRYRYDSANSKWIELDVLLYADKDGKIIGDLAGKADEAVHAETAATAAKANTAQQAEIAVVAQRLQTPVKINGVDFDGTRSINTGAGGDGASSSDAYQNLLWRTAQNEREIANIELAFEDANIFPDYNNLLVENFANGAAETDRLTVAVTSIAAGDNSLDVVDLSQLKVGKIYTLTDGSQQEYVQIKSMVKSGTTYRVMLENNTTNTYSSLPALYRTTASITENGAEGTGSSRIYQYATDTIWKGVNASTEVDIPLNTTTDNAAAFTITGDIAFTASGEITLT
jgi:hypothetical protein